jgi:hypothetical protein
VRCHVAITIFPFGSWFRAGCAKPAGRKFSTTIATLALLDDLMANPVVVRTPFCGHKRTLHTLFNSCTMHWNHPLDLDYFYKKKLGTVLDPANTD